MSDLRKATIRLAHKNPELRPALLPLLKQAGKPIQMTVELGGQQGDWAIYGGRGVGVVHFKARGEREEIAKLPEMLAEVAGRIWKLQNAGLFGPELVSAEAVPPNRAFVENVRSNTAMWSSTLVSYDPDTGRWTMKEGKGRLASTKTAGVFSGTDFLDTIYPARMYSDALKKMDKETAVLWGKVRRGIADALEPHDQTKEALNYYSSIINGYRNMDPAALRNYVFKAAHHLGIPLPSGLF